FTRSTTTRTARRSPAPAWISRKVRAARACRSRARCSTRYRTIRSSTGSRRARRTTEMSESKEPGVSRREHAHRLATELRRMIERLVLADAPESRLIAAAERVRAFSEWLADLPVRHWYEGFAEAANAGNPNALFDQSPLIGLSNPLAPPILIEIVPAPD